MNDRGESQHVIDRLMEFHEGALAPAETAAVRSHLRSCANCAAELKLVEDFSAKWHDSAVSLLVHSLPDLTGKHVEDDSLWVLADPETGPLSPQLKEDLDHALHCRQCYLALTACRNALVRPIDESELVAVAEDSWDRLRASYLKLFVAFIVAGGIAGERGRLRIRLDLPSSMRMLSDSGQALAEAAETDVGSPWEFEREFGDYSFKVVLTPRDFDRQTLEIGLKTESLPEGVTDRDLLAELTADKAAVASLEFSGGQVAFGTLPLANYTVSIVNASTQTTVGLIELAISTPNHSTTPEAA